MRILVILTVLGVGWCQTPTPGSPDVPRPPQGALTPRLVLSQVEQLRLENLKLKRQVIELQLQIAQQALTLEIQQFTREVLEAHGSPKGVVFDLQKMDFTYPVDSKEKKVGK